MQYLGGKARVSKKIAEYLRTIRKPNQIYFEPFVGAGWVLQEIENPRVASDGCEPLIHLYTALQQGWVPPDTVDREEYRYWKESSDLHNPMKAFCGFATSFGGKWFAGYASDGQGRNYARNGKNSLTQKMVRMGGVLFLHGDYAHFSPEDCLIYCDPPYVGVTTYGYFKTAFDHASFWDTMRRWSRNNTVVVSEYVAPDDFVCVKDFHVRLDLQSTDNSRVEKLFMHRG